MQTKSAAGLVPTKNPAQAELGRGTLRKTSLANAGVDIHIDVDSLIRDNGEELRFCPHVAGGASLHIEKIIARLQRNPIVSIPISGNPRDFFFSVPAHDDQWIFSVSFRCHRRCSSVRELNLVGRKNL